MDETQHQLIGQTRESIPAAPGQPEREDYEYRRLGTCRLTTDTARVKLRPLYPSLQV